MNKKGAAMVLALVISMSALPAVGVLVTIARSDLSSALDDYHSARVRRAAWGGLELVRRDLQEGGCGEATWPDPDIALEVEISESEGGWRVYITARSERAVATISTWVEGKN